MKIWLNNFGQNILDLVQSNSEDSIFLVFDGVMNTAYYGHTLGEGGAVLASMVGPVLEFIWPNG